MRDTQQEKLADDMTSVATLKVVPTLLQVLCDSTAMGFAGVARVTETRWTACAVLDEAGFGIEAGDELDVGTTLCKVVRESREPIVIDHASTDPRYQGHITPRLYGFESYISVPIVMADDEYFGNLFAADPQPRNVSQPRTVLLFTRIAQLIAGQLDLNKERKTAAGATADGALEGQRDLFISTLGQNLREPVLAVFENAAELQRKSWDPASLEIGKRLEVQAERLCSMIDDVLDFMRGRIGESTGLCFEDVARIEELFETTLAGARNAHPGRTIIANLAVDRTLRCDPRRLQQLARTLLENALSAGTPSGPVSFVALADGSDLVIEVWNDGEPLSDDEARTFFLPFAGTALARGTASTGLGLHVCWQIARAHDGSIGVTSPQGHGTQFVVRIPFVR